MSIYLIRNPKTGKWLSDNIFECEDPESSSRRFNSEKAARKCIKAMVARAKELNTYHQKQGGGFTMYPEHYEVVAFRLVEVGSLG